MQASFTIPGRLAGLNEMIGAARSHRMQSALQKRSETDRVRWIVRAAKVPRFTKPVRVSITWIEPHARRDLDNCSSAVKFVLDALVAEGCLRNDGRSWVRQIYHLFPDPDPQSPRVEVLLEELP